MSENKGSIKFIHQDADAIDKLGVYGSIPFQHLGFGTWSSVGKEITPEQAEKLKSRVEDVEWQGNLEVHLNSSSISRQLERLFESDRTTSLFSRALIGLPFTLGYGVLGKLANWNYYNPYTETLQLFNENEYIGLAKLGAMEVIDSTSGFKKELLSLVETLPTPFARLISLLGVEKAYTKLEEDEKHIAEKYLGSSIISGLVTDTLALGTALSVVQLVDPITSFLISGGFALTAQGILELRKRIKANRVEIFNKEGQVDISNKNIDNKVENDKLFNLST